MNFLFGSSSEQNTTPSVLAKNTTEVVEDSRNHSEQMNQDVLINNSTRLNLESTNDRTKLNVSRNSQRQLFGSGFDKAKLSMNNRSVSSANTQEKSPDDIALKTGVVYEISSNLVAFSRAIMAMSKLSESLVFQPSREGLFLKAINAAKSVYAVLQFSTTFFVNYDISELDEKAENYIKISMKSAMVLFKAPERANKTNISVNLRLDPKEDYMVIEFWQTSDCAKIVQIPLKECRPDLEFSEMKDDKNELTNMVVVSAKALMNYINQMGKDTDDIIMKATKDEFSLHKYITTDKDRSKEKKTEAKLDITLFDHYDIQKPTMLTISTKELKAILELANNITNAVSLHFDTPGEPIIVSLDTNVEFTADFILSTSEADLEDGGMDMAQVAQFLAQPPRKNRSQTNSISTPTSEPIQLKSKLGVTRIENHGSPPRVTQFAEKLTPQMPLTIQTQLFEMQPTEQDPLIDLTGYVRAQSDSTGYRTIQPNRTYVPDTADTQNLPYHQYYDENLAPNIYTPRKQLPPGRQPPEFEADFTPSPPKRTFKTDFLSVSQATIDKNELWRDEEVLVYDSDLGE